MDPLEFISVALRLATSQREADRRTAVGRAYYGAFHVARGFLVDCGLYFSPKEMFGAEIHRKIQYCLRQSANLSAVRAGNRLSTLRNQRNAADYDLESKAFGTTAAVLRMVRVAPDIVDAIQQCRRDPAFSETRDKIRAYARDILRITVRDE
jgi:uncharacterized protein (UPF0332 family)